MSCNCLCDDTVKLYIQGDTFKRQVSVIDSQGEPVDVELISKIELLLLDVGANILETYELPYDSELEKWAVEIDTSDWEEGTHLVRYRITYIDSSVETPYEITIQIKK